MSINSIVVLFLIVIPLGFGCSKFSETHEEFIYSFIDHIDEANIQAPSFQLPVYKTIEMNLNANSWKRAGKDSRIYPVMPKEGKDQNIANGIIEASFVFNDLKNKKKSSADLNNLFTEKKFIRVKESELKPFSGNWNVENAFVTNSPIQKDFNLIYGYNSLLHNLMSHPSMNPEQTPVIPDNINILFADIGLLKNFMATVEIIFDTKPLKQGTFINFLGQDREIKKSRVIGLAGIFLGFIKIGEKSKAIFEGYVVLIEKDSWIIFAELKNSKLVNPKVLGIPFFPDNIDNPSHKIGNKLSIKVVDNDLEIWVGNYLHRIHSLPDRAINKGHIGLVNAVRDDTKFFNFKYKIITIPTTNSAKRSAGIFFRHNRGQDGYFVDLSPEGFLSFGKVGQKPLRSKLVDKNRVKSKNKLEVNFFRNSYLIYLNGQLEMHIHDLPSVKPFNFKSFVLKKDKGLYLQKRKVNFIPDQKSVKPPDNNGLWGLIQTERGAKFDEVKYFSFSAISEEDRAFLGKDTRALGKILLFLDNAASLRTKYKVSDAKVDETTRKAIVIRGPSQIRYQLNIPKRSYLSFGTTVLSDILERREEVNFSISIQIQPDGKKEEIFSQTLDWKDPPGWQDNRVDLSSYGDKDVKINFKVESQDKNFAFWGNPQVLIEREEDQLNVILISIDTLRADHLSSYGYELNTSPHMDAIAQEGVLFKYAISQAPWTYPSHAAMFTSLYPSALGFKMIPNVLSSGNIILPDNAKTITEILRRHGYLTGAFVGGFPVGVQNGFAQGFSFYNQKWTEDIEVVSNQLTEWIHKHQRDKFFLFFHTFEVHQYPPGEHEIFAHRIDSSEKLKRTIALYDGKIRLVDGYIGLLVEYLKKLRLAKKTLVIITSDHGEGFYEHGYEKHGYGLYDELLRVPLIFYLPGSLPENVVVDSQVRIIDIMPTILDILKIPVNDNLNGKTLRLFFNNGSEERVAFSEATSNLRHGVQKSIRTNQYKYIEYSPLESSVMELLNKRKDKNVGKFIDLDKFSKMEKYELYDLSRNPGELKQNRMKDESLVEELSVRIKEFNRANQKRWHLVKRTTDEKDIKIDEDTKRHLQALGYLQ